MKHVCIFICFALMFPIYIVAQDKPLDLQIQYNKETKNLVLTITNKAKSEVFFINDRGNQQSSLFWLQAYDVDNQCIFELDFIYQQDGEIFKQAFFIQPGETIVCSYPSLVKRYIEENHPSTKKIGIEAWLSYGTKEQHFRDKVKVSFDY
ncbi:MAG: hypothetical protein K2I15_10825 [Bacteroides sp.]|nr:hypothetical protein [Bacteroides sp.]